MIKILIQILIFSLFFVLIFAINRLFMQISFNVSFKEDDIFKMYFYGFGSDIRAISSLFLPLLLCGFLSYFKLFIRGGVL